MVRILLSLSLLFGPAALAAQEWELDDGDFFGTGLSSRFYRPEKPYFAPDGSVRRGGGDARPEDYGLFTLLPDGRLCLDNTDASDRCSVYVRDGQMRLLVTEGGRRLPFRFELGLGN